MDELLRETLRIVDQNDLPMALFTADADVGLADGNTYSSAELRRMRDAYASWPATRPRRRRRAAYPSSVTGDASGSSWWWGGGFIGGGDGGWGGSDGGGGGCGGGGCGGGG
jgi:hypothetical protein